MSQQGSLISLAHVRNESSARYVCSARVNLSCWQVELVMSESTGSRSRLIMSEMFVFCSGLLVSLTFRVSCQRSRLSEIRWLNVKQPTSTRLRLDQDRTRSGPVRLAFETRHERVELALARTGPSSISNGISVVVSSTQSPTMLARLDPRESGLVSVTYRVGSRVWCSPRVARLLSDRNCELSANTPRGLETCSGVIGHSYLH